MKLTLTKVYRSDKDKNGKPLVSKKDQKPYTKIAIKCQEYGERWLSGFGAKWNDYWNEGDIVEAEVEENGEYLNLKRINPLADLTKRVLALEKAVYQGPTVRYDTGITGEFGEPVQQ